MIIEGLLTIIFSWLTLIFDLIPLPELPSNVWNVVDTVNGYLVSGYRFGQYFFDQTMYTYTVNILLVLIAAKPTVKIAMWIYNKTRGC